MSTIEAEQKKIVAEFSLLNDWMDRYEYLIQLGGELPPLEARYKTPEFLIEGCQSRVWLVPEFSEGKVFFRADSDAEIPKGIISLLLKVFSGRTPEEILQHELFFIREIGLAENLSPTRSNGLLQMVRQMKWYAMAYQSQQTRFT